MKRHFKSWAMIMTPLAIGLVALGLLTWRDISSREGRWLKLGDTVQPDCSDPRNRRSIFYETTPKNELGPLVVEITVTRNIVPGERELVAKGSDVSGQEKTSALARIDRVIRGSLETTEVEIGAAPLCTDRSDYAVGAVGIIVGRTSDTGKRWGVGPFWRFEPTTRVIGHF